MPDFSGITYPRSLTKGSENTWYTALDGGPQVSDHAVGSPEDSIGRVGIAFEQTLLMCSL